jgi:hypothetical protein
MVKRGGHLERRVQRASDAVLAFLLAFLSLQRQ